MRDFLKSLGKLYFPVLLIHLPFVILIFIEKIPIFRLPIIPSYSPYFELSVYSLANFIYSWIAFPYLQGVSIIYIYQYLESRRTTFEPFYYKWCFSKLLKLLLGHFLMSLIILCIVLPVTIIIAPISIDLSFIFNSGTILLAVIIIFSISMFAYSRVILIPPLLIINKGQESNFGMLPVPGKK